MTKGIVKVVHSTSFTFHYSLRDKRKGWTAGLKAVLKESIVNALLSISHLWTNERDGQAGLKAVLKECIGHSLLSISPLGTKVMGWTSRTICRSP